MVIVVNSFKSGIDDWTITCPLKCVYHVLTLHFSIMLVSEYQLLDLSAEVVHCNVSHTFRMV